MKYPLVIFLVSALVLVGCRPTAVAPETSPAASSDQQQTAQIPATDELEATAMEFINAFIQTAPPEASQEAADTAYYLLSESLQQQVSDSLPKMSRDLAALVGVQDVPDQGVSIEDVQFPAPDQPQVIVGLNYSGSGQLLRTISFVQENGDWKISAISE